MEVRNTFDSAWQAVSKLSFAEKQRLVRKIHSEERQARKTAFPHIDKDWKPAPIVYEMVAERLPVEVDVEAEKKKMWEEWAE